MQERSFCPPPLPPEHLPRERLINLLQQHPFARIILFEATAGYGKSVAVTEFVQQLDSAAAWYSLQDLEKRTPLAFIWNLVRSVQTARPGFGRPIESLLEESDRVQQQVSSEQWLRQTILPALTSELAALNSPLWIVLENYHTLHNDEINDALIYLVEKSPLHTRFIVTSRLAPRWPARPRWQAQELLVAISKKELAFSQAESQALAHQMGIFLDQHQLASIYANIGGWPVLHHLLYTHCRQRAPQGVETILDFLIRPNQTIYNYLAEELLNRQSSAVRDFLCQTSILRQLDTETCNALLGIGNAGKILDDLGDNLFLQLDQDSTFSPISVHSHEIIRDFLQQVLWQEYSQEQVFRLHTHLAELYQAKGEWEKAIKHYCQGQQPTPVSRLIFEQAPFLISTEDWARLEDWLKPIPQSWIKGDPILMAYKGIALGNRQSPLAEEYLLQAQHLFDLIGDQIHATWVKGELGCLYNLEGKHERAIETLESALSWPALPPRFRARFLYCATVTLENLARPGESIVYGEQAAQLFRQLGSREGSVALTRLLRQLSLIYHALGRPREALQASKEAYRLIQTLDLGNWSLAWINNQLANIQRYLGRFAESHACLDEADQLLAKYRRLGSESRLLDYVLITRGHLYRDTYDHERAEEYYCRANRGHPNGVMLALHLVQPNHAREALELAWEKWREKQHHKSVVERSLYQILLGLAYLNTENYAQARLHMEEADQVLEQRGFLYNLITVRVYLAKLCFELNELSQAKEYLRYTLSEMSRTGYHNLDVWQPWTIAEMCAQAIQYNIEPDFVEQLVLKRLTSHFVEPFLALINHPEALVRGRTLQILQHWSAQVGRIAHQKLKNCRDEATQDRLGEWLDQGWLTGIGLLRLEQLLSWREVEVFLLWVTPALRGSTSQIAQELFVTTDTINTHLKKFRSKLESAQIISFKLRGKGAYLKAYDWAVRSGIVDPYAPSPSNSA